MKINIFIGLAVLAVYALIWAMCNLWSEVS